MTQANLQRIPGPRPTVIHAPGVFHPVDYPGATVRRFNAPAAIEAVRQVSREAGMGDLETLTLLQAGAAALGDELTLGVLCAIKADLLGLNA